MFTIGTDGGTSIIDGNTNWKTFIVVEGAGVRFDAGDIFTCKNFIANGVVGNQITMDTDDGNTVDFFATVVNSGGDGKVHYVNAYDIVSWDGALITTVGGSIDAGCVNWAWVDAVSYYPMPCFKP